MAGANTDPPWTRAAGFGPIAVTAANTSSQGGGTIATDIFLAFTADATNGSYISRVEWILGESTIATTSTGTVGRIFISTQTSGATTSANTHLWREVALIAQTPSSTLAGVPIIVPANFWLKAGQTILVTNHAAPAANTHWKAMVFGGDY
jgi:hypothetical protein